MKPDKVFYIIGIVVLAIIVVVVISFLRQSKTPVPPQTTSLLQQLCPGETEFSCEKPLGCVNNTVTFNAYLYSPNIFPEENRLLVTENKPGAPAVNGNPGMTLEIRLTDNSSTIFPNLKTGADQQKMVKVTGTVGAFIAPMNGACRQLIYVQTDSSNIEILG